MAAAPPDTTQLSRRDRLQRLDRAGITVFREWETPFDPPFPPTFNYTMASTLAPAPPVPDLIVTTPTVTLDGAISRASALMDHAGTSGGKHLEEYAYLGLGTIVLDNRPEDSTELTYVQVSGDSSYNADGGDAYTGLDRFGRVIDQYWLNTASSPNAIDRFQYGYDRDGNVLYERNLVNGAFSELFHANSSTSGDNNTAYDPLDQLTSFLRGTLSSSGNNGSLLDTISNANVNSTFSDSAATWTLDALGNWTSSASGIGSGGSSAPTLTSTSRTENAQNEIGTVVASSLTYDNNGNLTKNAQGDTLTYDAWNRLITSTNLSLVMTYDALGRPTHFVTSSGNNNYIYHDSSGHWIQDSRQRHLRTVRLWPAVSERVDPPRPTPRLRQLRYQRQRLGPAHLRSVRCGLRHDEPLPNQRHAGSSGADHV